MKREGRRTEPGRRQRSRDGRWPGNDLDRDLSLQGGADEAISGIRDGRHAGIGNEGQMLALLKTGEQLGGTLGFVKLVITHKRLADLIMGEEMAGVPRIFSRHQ